MSEFKVSLDQISYTSKPNKSEIFRLNDEIANRIVTFNRDRIKSFAQLVGENGRTFCPSTFKDGPDTFYGRRKKIKNFEQEQLFVLDFDNDKTDIPKITFEEAKKRADKYNLPMLFAYETLSSTNQDRFRTVFLNDVPVSEPKVAQSMIKSLLTIFPEADSQCSDISRMYFGGKRLLHFDSNIPKINIADLFMDMTRYLYNKHGPNHYKTKLTEFCKKTGIKLNKNNLPDIFVYDDIAEYDPGKFSPKTIIVPKIKNIIDNGEILPTKYYAVNFFDDNESPQTDGETTESNKNHNHLRSPDIKIIREKCRLFREFENGSKWLFHNELRGIAMNFVHIETGRKVFLDILLAHSHFKSYADKYNIWDFYLGYFKQSNYNPESCGNYCPYKDECHYGTNIISTVKSKFHSVTRLANYNLKFYDIKEAAADVRDKILFALNAADNGIYVILAQAAIGKTQIYLEIIKDSDKKFLIAVPTNLLKHDVFRRAEVMGLIKIIETPSLLEILEKNKSEIPTDVREYINKLYNAGKHKSVVPYIKKILKMQDIPCLQEYLNELDEIKNFDGHIITTHRKFFTLDEDTLGKYEVIIDEDIIFKAVLPNQKTVTVSVLEKALKKLNNSGTNTEMADKIEQILECCANGKDLFTVEETEFDEDGDDTQWEWDVSSMCGAEKFCYLKESVQENIPEDCISFFTPVTFPNVKLTIVSATANEDIYRYYFEPHREVRFFCCKTAKNEGMLRWYYNKTMSRGTLKENLHTFDAIKKKYKGFPIITFLKFKDHVDDEILHFGNTEGYDGYEGHDIVVCGTPHFPPFIYRLFAYTIGLPFDADVKIKHNQLVEHNGYQFYFTTFDDKYLRDIQFWMIESELEQAVGRARILRKQCTVHLFAKFPLKQAIPEWFDWSEYDKTLETESE